MQNIGRKFFSYGKNFLNYQSKIFFISESADWVINDICKNIAREINFKHSRIAQITYSPLFLKNKIVHFGSINTILSAEKILKVDHSNRLVLTWFHVLANDKRVKYISDLNRKIDIVHTACKITRDKLIDNGFDKKKVVLIPLGVDLKNFKPVDVAVKTAIKKKINLPVGKLVVGSFQKDGVGWGEGLNPKLEKGPDIFCDVIEKISKHYDVHVLLTGPARGYVKNRLSKAGISYTHKYLKNYSEIVDYYNVLDLYLITSREEGGPKAVLECMATGVPLVSTAVGMVRDVIKDGVNGMVAEVEDVDALVNKILQICTNKNFRDLLVAQAIVDVKIFSWDNIAKKYYNLLYQNLL